MTLVYLKKYYYRLLLVKHKYIKKQYTIFMYKFFNRSFENSIQLKLRDTSLLYATVINMVFKFYVSFIYLVTIIHPIVIIFIDRLFLPNIMPFLSN